MTAQRASCRPHSYPKVLSGVSTHTQENAGLANAIPEGSKMIPTTRPVPGKTPDDHEATVNAGALALKETFMTDEAKAEAWDDGWHAAANWRQIHENPYRSQIVTTEPVSAEAYLYPKEGK